MTFKHVKFEDSPTMRALEKVAQEKGLIKPEQRQKTAAEAPKEADLEPTSNLMENIFKLCAGLRDKGFHKEAAELEINYFNYKRAQTLYDTHKEKGEDVLNFAHPKGSHKLEGVEGNEATVEDLLDRQAKIMQAVEKKPTGKLESNAHVVSEVKKALGQFARPTSQTGQAGGQSGAPSSVRPNDAAGVVEAKKEMHAADADVQAALKMAKGGGLTGIVMSWAQGRGSVVSGVANNPSMTPDNINDAKSAIDALSRNLHPNFLHNYLPEFLNKGISTDALWGVISQKLDSASSHCDQAITQLAEEMGKASSVSKRMQQLLALAQSDPEAIKKGKEAMVQALKLVDRGLGAFLNVFYGELLNQEKPDIEAARKQINDLISKIDPNSEEDVANQVMQDIAAQVAGTKSEVDKLRARFSKDGDEKITDADWWRKFNYAASLVGQGQSMSWGAAKAINNGDLSGLQFHAAHISSDEVMNVINYALLRPLQQLKSDLGSVTADQIKSPQLKQFYQPLSEDLNNAVNAASNAQSGVMNNSDQNLRVIHPSKFAQLFAAPLDKDDRGRPLFAGVTTLDALKAKAAGIVSIYKKYVDQIKKSVG